MNSEFLDSFYQTILLPFRDEVNFSAETVKDSGAEELRQRIGRISETESAYRKAATEELARVPAQLYNISREQYKEILGNLKVAQTLLLKLACEMEKGCSDLTADLFIAFTSLQLALNSRTLEEKNTLDLYKGTARKIIDLEPEKHGIRETTLLKLLRNYYLAYHASEYESDRAVYTYTLGLLKKDMELSAHLDLLNQLQALKNYLSISLDHLFISTNTDVAYIELADFELRFSEFKKKMRSYLNEAEAGNLSLFSFFLIPFKINLYKLQEQFIHSKVINTGLKSHLLEMCAELIGLYYDEAADYTLFFASTSLSTVLESAFDKEKYGRIIKKLSSRLILILNEKQKNVMDMLYLTLLCLSNFKEYMKLSVNISKKITLNLNPFFNRKIFILSQIIYLRLFEDAPTFKKGIIKIRQNIESNPVKALISVYNHELNLIKFLPQETLNNLKIDAFVERIYAKHQELNKFITTSSFNFMKNLEKSENFQNTLNSLKFFRNEIKNIFTLAGDSSLIRDLGRLYCYFIDNFVKNEHMEYREDFIQRATTVKLMIFDINPYHFAMTLSYSKLGKLKLILSSNDRFNFQLRKANLSDHEKEQIALFIPMSEQLIPLDEKDINKSSARLTLAHLRDPAISAKSAAPPQSRILKVLSALINKITRKNTDIQSLFPSLYEESFLPGKRQWDLDPIIIFYFNAYFAKKGIVSFFQESTGDLLNIRFNLYNNSLVNEKINDFLKDLIEKTDATGIDIVSQLEELSRLNEINLETKTNEKTQVSLDGVKNYIAAANPVFLEKAYLEPEDIKYLLKVLEYFFIALGNQSYLLAFRIILSELINNANNANLLRAHFNRINQDIDLRYELGLKTFADSKKNNLGKLLELNSHASLKVKVTFHAANDYFHLSVANNYKIHTKESDSINEKMQTAQTHKDIKDILNKKYASDNPRGFGLILSYQLLKYCGIKGDFFKLSIKSHETVFKISIPNLMVSEKDTFVIAEELSREIEQIPVLQTQIAKLIDVINNPLSSIEEIVTLVISDPSLTADIIKIANSVYFRTTNPVKNIRDAVKILGMKNLNNIIITSNSYKLLEDKASTQKLAAIIEHSELTAFFAKEIIEQFKLNANKEDVHLAALLHDLGQIIVEGLHPDIYKKIQSIFENKRIPVNIIEDLAGGLNHALIGFKLAEKWNFPEITQEVIKHHHTPHLAEKYTEEVYIVYLANMMTHYTRGKIVFENIDPAVLEHFQLNEPSKLEGFSAGLKQIENIFKS